MSAGKAYTHLFLVGARPQSEQRHCEKTGYGVKPALFITCTFHDLRIIFTEKETGALLSGHPSSFQKSVRSLNQ
jgi:hypothetical protein